MEIYGGLGGVFIVLLRNPMNAMNAMDFDDLDNVVNYKADLGTPIIDPDNISLIWVDEN